MRNLLKFLFIFSSFIFINNVYAIPMITGETPVVAIDMNEVGINRTNIINGDVSLLMWVLPAGTVISSNEPSPLGIFNADTLINYVDADDFGEIDLAKLAKIKGQFMLIDFYGQGQYYHMMTLPDAGIRAIIFPANKTKSSYVNKMGTAVLADDSKRKVQVINLDNALLATITDIPPEHPETE